MLRRFLFSLVRIFFKRELDEIFYDAIRRGQKNENEKYYRTNDYAQTVLQWLEPEPTLQRVPHDLAGHLSGFDWSDAEELNRILESANELAFEVDMPMLQTFKDNMRRQDRPYNPDSVLLGVAIERWLLVFIGKKLSNKVEVNQLLEESWKEARLEMLRRGVISFEADKELHKRAGELAQQKLAAEPRNEISLTTDPELN